MQQVTGFQIFELHKYVSQLMTLLGLLGQSHMSASGGCNMVWSCP